MKIAYLLFQDAPQMKDKSQPDEMVAEVRQVDKDMPKPWVNCTPQQFTEYSMSIAPIQAEWEKSQPYLVEVKKGQREEWALQEQPTGVVELRPKPVLQQEQ